MVQGQPGGWSGQSWGRREKQEKGGQRMRRGQIGRGPMDDSQDSGCYFDLDGSHGWVLSRKVTQSGSKHPHGRCETRGLRAEVEEKDREEAAGGWR